MKLGKWVLLNTLSLCAQFGLELTNRRIAAWCCVQYNRPSRSPSTVKVTEISILVSSLYYYSNSAHNTHYMYERN